ncbi:hypothetical protein [Roseospira goensis]|uniref:Uncharacterized protein n=1 Tax=Roseospira goensis TaxID=391922 RepID=A0A7W6RX07_9PROT|nr:hypothetical protein [Roseospira goensis]MBB4284780.1 hypothetical protein [Roseospira goensis]
MAQEKFQASRVNKAGTVRCNCVCWNSDAVAQATGMGMGEMMEDPGSSCRCTCYCQAGQAANQQMGDTTATSEAAG